MTIPQALALALQHHEAGRLPQAEAIYRQILAVQPNHADAFHLLGVIAHQFGRYEEAIAFFRNAIAVNPLAFHYHLNLGNALTAQGLIDDGIAAFRRALEINPKFAAADNNLGDGLMRIGKTEEAVAAFQRAMQSDPRLPEAHNNLGNALFAQGRVDEAILSFDLAIQLKPEFVESHDNLGKALRKCGQLDRAAASFQRAVQHKPGFLEAHINLGSVLREVGRSEEAVAAFRQAIQISPNSPDAHNHLANALQDCGCLEEAISEYRYALRIKPEIPDALLNLGNALRLQGVLDESIATYRQALRVRPESADAYNNLANALMDGGYLNEAIGAYRDAIRLNPDHAGMHSNLIYALHFLPSDNSAAIAEEHQRWNQKFSEPLKPFILPHANNRDPVRRLRVGYVSPDFRDHVVGRYMLPVLERHDRERFEVICYSGVLRADSMTERFQSLSAQWKNTVGVSDNDVAEMIRQDRVDILIDLTQHTAQNRLPVFARKPAPVQVSFAGYPESAGLDAIEYRISDQYLDGASGEHEAGKNEHVCLIDSFYCYDPCGMNVEVNTLPTLESGTVTFGCLNNFSKVNERALNLWAMMLRQIKNSRLVLASHRGKHRDLAMESLRRNGVAPGQVEFVEYRPRREYMELYHRLDIALDTFPYNGGVTTCEALWMGIPVVSLVGKRPVSRAGLSLLTNVGLAETIARSEMDYVNIAVELAKNLPNLARVRSTLRSRMESSVIMNPHRFTQKVEQAYRGMWHAWCASQVPGLIPFPLPCQ